MGRENDKSEGFRCEDGVAMFVLPHSGHYGDVWRWLVVEVENYNYIVHNVLCISDYILTS